ncbi:hypothetical protein HYH03_001036 [Edaphochlamys debaryana]|uniref:alpha-mannosidase n=1 Tax=Edaphochlamys debaryana TaxID=47281 RepID=A0A835YE53_9CHLO|nr:hypothetical protein HYH03_001036 [Edaphochlamys debaryana]|eukprot:KAG2501227.1 hypothetical protein HYH03_001036 [Edaphochlamys debaryana]
MAARSAPAGGGARGAGPPNPAPWVPQHHRDITLGRLDGFLNQGQFADVNLRAELWAASCASGVRLEVYSHPKDVPYPSYDEAVQMPYRPCRVGDSFGPSWTTHWFRIRACVPAEWEGMGPLMFRWDSGSEAMLYDNGPVPRQGITDQRNEYQLAERAVGGQELLFYVEMAANGMFGTGPEGIAPPDENRYYTLKTAELAIPNAPVQALWHDLRALTGLARELPPGDATGEAALYTANKIVNTYRRGDPASVAACRELAAGVLGVRDPGARMQVYAVYAVGHCHIDTAWLWPFSETHRKTARSWSAQLRLAERFPWHVFTASSAQQYQWLMQDYPGLFEEIRGAVQRGQFVPVGGTWVEMDTNLPSAESLVRQFLYGQRFFEQQYGAPCDVFWLPDTFGYSGQLPQIAQGAGIRYFMTQKLSWNNINAFPHSTFWWEGLDGSRLLTHFPPANTYNAQADAKDILATANGSKDKDRSPSAYMLFGNGDGGGGPTVDMLESLSRLAGCRGVASLALASPSAFFTALEAGARDLLTWRGELYFELHRGTYTSHAANKNNNRQCELLLREVEAAGALAAAVVPAYAYPRSDLDAIWKDVLLYQFHDVLPGSAIGRVYDVTAKRYPQMLSQLRHLRDAALAALLATAAAAPTATAAAPTATAAAPTAAAAAPTATAAATMAAATAPPTAASASDVAAAGLASLGLGPTEVVGARHLPLSGAPMGAPPSQPSSQTPSQTLAYYFNSLSQHRREVVGLPAALLGAQAHVGPDRAPAVLQWASDGTEALVIIEAPPLSLTPVCSADVARGVAGVGPAGPGEGPGPGLGLAWAWDGQAASLTAVRRSACPWLTKAAAGAEGAGGDDVVYCMQNTMVRVVFDGSGRLLSLTDLIWRRELVPEGAMGNVFRLYEDIPLFWDAWDIEVYHLEKSRLAGEGMPPPKVSILEQGPLRVRLSLEAALTPTSTIKQVITLTSVSPRLEFHTEVDWSESRTALKVEFPWALDAPLASYEVQAGAVQRPTHTNTSWDWARFEVCAHKWADLSEPGYGVALLNDCKYGHGTHGNTMRLTLLRSPKAPDAHTDMGVHPLRYGIVPHALGWEAAGVPSYAWAFNAPLRAVAPPPEPQPPRQSHIAAAAAAAAGCGLSASFGDSNDMLYGANPLSYDPTEPFISVSSASPNPLAAAAALAARAPHSPPLVLDTVKLTEPPLAMPPPPPPAAAAATPVGAPAPTPAEALVVRLYEPCGARGVARVSWPAWLHVTRVTSCDLLERDDPVEGVEEGAGEGAGEGVQGARGSAAAEGKRDAGRWRPRLQEVRVNAAPGSGSGSGGGGSVDVPYLPYKIITLKLYLEQGGR